MQYMISTFAHGNGPYSRMIDLGLAINKELKLRNLPQHSIIVPLVYGERQKGIILEEFGEDIRKDKNSILLDEFYGGILNALFFKTGHYQENLEFLLENQPRLEETLRNYLSGKLKLKTFDGKELSINGSDIKFEISHNPRVATGYEKSFYTTIAYFSEILERTTQECLEGKLDFNHSLLREVREKIAEKIERDKKVHFMPEPFVFSYDENRKRWRDEIFTPPLIQLPHKDETKVKEGMYVMVTGIDGLQSLFEGVNQFGLQLYCPPFIKIEGADSTHAPSFVANQNIKYQFARTGWSTVWLSHITETPLIAPAYIKGDDPEIYFNEKSVRKLSLATIWDKSLNPKEVLKRAIATRPLLINLNRKLERNYGTLDGIDYTASAIVDSLEGKTLSGYKSVEAALIK